MKSKWPLEAMRSERQFGKGGSMGEVEGYGIRGAYVWGPTFVSSCIISAKSDNRRPSCGDTNNSRWPASAIFDYGRKHIWTILHVIYVHSKYGEDILIGGTDMPAKTEFENTPTGGGILLPVPTHHVS